jgi:TonB family protein
MLMKRCSTIAFLVLSSLLLLAPAAAAQQETTTERKVVNRVTPHYPEMARTMDLKGSVKAEAVVEPNGTVKLVEVKGGHPLLVRAAENAIYKWRWAPAPHETREPIEVKFDPE